MATAPVDAGPPRWLRAEAGPLDGAVLELAAGADELHVTTTDGTVHVYRLRASDDDVVLAWAGRR